MHRYAVLLFGLAFEALAVSAIADVDQQCSPEYWGEYSIALGTPVGQEFVPAVAILSYAELWIINNPSSLDDTARVFVVIHPDSMGGPELATSPDIAIPKPFDDSVRFVFAEPVVLETGRTYVIEARRSAGPGNPTLLWGDQAGSCPNISGIWLGTRFVTGGDFWYRTGYELTPTDKISWGRLKSRYD